MARGGRVIYKRAAPGRKRSRRSKASDDDDDDDDEEYILEEEEEAEDDESSDEPLASDGEEEEEYEFGESTSGSDDEEPAADELDEDDDEEFLAPRSKRRRAPSKPKRKVIKKSRVFDDDYDYDYNDDDEEEEDEDVSVQNKGRRRNKAAARPHRQKSRDSDYEEYEREEGDDDEDEDFSPDEHDLDEEGFLTSGLKRRGGDLKHGGNKRKPRVLRQKKGKKRRRNRSEDDFIVKDHVAGDGKKKETKKLRRKKSSTSMTIKKKSPVESDTSDFEFITSDDDFVEDTIMLDGRGSKNKNAGKTNARGARRRNVVLSDESESSSDGDYMISEEELRDLGVGGILDQPQPKRIIAGRKDDEKGKEKENVDFGKPLCGICLSEEQRTTVRGVLNCCAHYFCFACIMEWSKVESRCPICKRRFGTITKSSRSDPGFGLRKAVIKVEKRDQVYQPSEEEIRRMLDPYENVVCIECHQGGDDSLMLLCDICDSPAHTYCVGLGREVPEGNWYCECCRSAADGSSYLHNQGIVTDQAASSSDFLASRIETEDVAVRDNTNSQRSSQPSLQDIDLNVSPRSAEDYGSMSQPFGAGASTLSGRRAIHQRIRILLSNNRPRQIFAETDVSHGNIRSDVMTSDVRRSGENLHSSQGLSWNMASSTEQCQQSNRPSLQSSANLVQCTTAGSSFRQVDGAKEQVMSMVKRHVKELCSDSPLDHATLKEIIRRATNTILAACGIKHNRRMVSAPVHPPSSCSHNLEQERIILTQGCCFLCFSSYIKDVVQKILHAT